MTTKHEIKSAPSARTKYACPCCECLTLETLHCWEICPVCFWEDDLFQYHHPDSTNGPNVPSLRAARANFKEMGACEERWLPHCRPPDEQEKPKNFW